MFSDGVRRHTSPVTTPKKRISASQASHSLDYSNNTITPFPHSTYTQSCATNPTHTPPFVAPATLRLDTWRRELRGDPDADYLLAGIETGFRIVDSVGPPSPAECDNYRSATNDHQAVEKQILNELAEGRYMILDHKPPLISALGAITKPDGSIRIIHDCSRPDGSSLNSYVEEMHTVSYESVKSAVNLMTKNCYLAKVDLKSAYRSVLLDPSMLQYTGFKWKFTGDNEFTYMCDKCLCFGSRKAPAIFTMLSQAVKRMMAKRGVDVVVYLDDFLIVSDSYRDCLQSVNILISLLRDLGFAISWPKVEGPSQCLTFLGIEINTVSQTLALPQNKVDALLSQLAQFNTLKRASRKQLQQLAGKLSWASHVVSGGRTYLQRVFDALRPLKRPQHKVKLNAEIKADVLWWIHCLNVFNTKSFVTKNARTHHVFTDACAEGAGMVTDYDWAYVNFSKDVPWLYAHHINVKETMATIFSLYRWAPLFANSVVVIHTDNITTRAALNKGACRTPVLMPFLRSVFWLSMWFNFEIKCVHIKGTDNFIADACSRLHSWGHMLYWYSLISNGSPFSCKQFAVGSRAHVSASACSHILQQVRPRIPWLRNATER